jgi:hypothetical protein
MRYGFRERASVLGYTYIASLNVESCGAYSYHYALKG